MVDHIALVRLSRKLNATSCGYEVATGKVHHIIGLIILILSLRDLTASTSLISDLKALSGEWLYDSLQDIVTRLYRIVDVHSISVGGFTIDDPALDIVCLCIALDP